MPEDPESRSRTMRAVKSKDTAPEMLVRRMIHAEGFRYRLHDPSLPGKPDLVFKSRRKAIFVHGCFWHGHSCKRGARIPATNRDYWRRKIQANVDRDKKHRAALHALGWDVLTVWECETRDHDALRSRILAFLGR
ncbi:MAG: DNA mismatch endonuclease Vsr [Candidatus Hydrogenedentes bacterium]|nr:DNA mismatch endonuclease Vsr [Candidatus Hydrogenedentota bacterium]